MKRKALRSGILVLLLLMVLPAFLVFGGGRQEAGPKEIGDYQFTYVSPIIGHPYWLEVDRGVETAAKDFGINVEIVGPTRVDANEQIQFLETAIASQVDGIITMALNPASFTPVINTAMENGIPVMLLDGDAATSKRLAYFGSNNSTLGLEVAKVIEKLTGGDARVGIVTAGLDLEHINNRIDAMRDYFTDKPGMSIVALEDSRADTALAAEKAIAMLQSNPDINVLFGGGAADSPGVAQAIEELGLTGKVIGIGFDDIPQTLDYVRRGVLQVCIAQRPYQMGYQAVEALYKTVILGEKVTGVFDTGASIVTIDNIDTYRN
jgi:ribose transport system substrate-binding protein